MTEVKPQFLDFKVSCAHLVSHDFQCLMVIYYYFRYYLAACLSIIQVHPPSLYYAGLQFDQQHVIELCATFFNLIMYILNISS